MATPNDGRGRGSTDGAYSCVIVDATSNVVIDPPSRALEIDADGSVEVVFWDDTTSVVRPFKAGVERPFIVKEIRAAGTTVASVAVYR